MHISPVLVGGALNGDRAQERGYLILYIATVFNVFVHDYTHAKGCGCVYNHVCEMDLWETSCFFERMQKQQGSFVLVNGRSPHAAPTRIVKKKQPPTVYETEIASTDNNYWTLK